MKNAITHVLTFIGVIAILVALRGTEAAENIVASIHQASSTDSKVEQYREDLREEGAKNEEDWTRYLEIAVKPKVTSACWTRRKCTDEDLEIYGHAWADYENAIVEEGDDYVAEYRHEYQAIGFFYEMEEMMQLDLDDPEIIRALDSEAMPMHDAICIEYKVQLGMGYSYVFVFWGANGTDYSLFVTEESCS